MVFRWRLNWVWHRAQRGPAKKVLFVDELWRFVNAQQLPAELEKVARMPEGDEWTVEFVSYIPTDAIKDFLKARYAKAFEVQICADAGKVF